MSIHWIQEYETVWRCWQDEKQVGIVAQTADPDLWFWRSFHPEGYHNIAEGYDLFEDAKRTVEGYAREMQEQEQAIAEAEAQLPTQEQLVQMLVDRPFKGLALLSGSSLIGLCAVFTLIKTGLAGDLGAFLALAIPFVAFILTLEVGGRFK